MWRCAFLFALIASSANAQSATTLQIIDGEYKLGAYDYFCTDANGDRRELGEVVCLNNNSCSPAWLAKCDMSLNNPMWRKVQDGCPAATLLQRFQRLQPASNALAVDAAISKAKS